MCFSAKSRIFACKLQKALFMDDEKRYPILDEEDDMTLRTAEPVAGAALAYAPSYFDEDNLPLIGPATYEDAIERIEQAEREIDNDEGLDWDDFKLLLKSRYTAVSYAI